MHRLCRTSAKQIVILCGQFFEWVFTTPSARWHIARQYKLESSAHDAPSAAFTYIYIHACKRGVHLLLIRIRLRWREESREGYVRVTPALKSYTRSRVPACVVGVIYECYANTMKNAEVLMNEESTMETIFARDQRTTSHRVLDATAESYEILPLQAKTQTYIKENFYKYNYDLPNSKCITSLPYSVAETARTKRNYSQRHLSRDSHLSDRRRWSYCTPRVTLTMLICK